MLEEQAGRSQADRSQVEAPAWKRHGGYVALVGILVLAGIAPMPLRPAADKQSVAKTERTQHELPQERLLTSLGVSGGSALALQPPPSPDEQESSPQPPATRQVEQVAHTAATSGIPANVLRAYRQAARSLADADPGCGLSVALLAAIGRVESGHAWGGAVDERGHTLRPIIGPRLDGGGTAAIRDTDGGRWDGDDQWDRAVGPMQFIPSTWSAWGVDADGDGVASPSNVFDAALAAGRYLCAGGGSLDDPETLRLAILSYNSSFRYLTVVLRWLDVYSGGMDAVAASPALYARSGSSGEAAEDGNGQSRAADGSGASGEGESAESDGEDAGSSDEEDSTEKENEGGLLQPPDDTGPVPAPQPSELVESGKKAVSETSRGIGRGVEEVGEKVGETVDEVGQNAGDAVGGAVGDELGKHVEEQVGNVGAVLGRR